jgi:putative ABC transport system ATP-binding protein
MRRLWIDDLTIEFRSGGYLLRPVENFSFEAHSGELILLLGPSGCGKTTLLSAIAGILTPTRGSIWVDDVDVTAMSAKEMSEYRRHTVGIVFQGFKLIASLTARENVEAPLRLDGWNRRAARERAETLLTQFELGERMGHRPGRMSGGQQQRVAIARALAHDPQLIVADEPTGQLDYLQVESVVQALRSLASPGRIVVVSTHDQRLVPLADRVVELGPTRAENSAKTNVTLASGEVLFEQGTRGELIYMVESGRIALSRVRSDGSVEVLHVAQPGEYFGELSPMLGFPRAATATALEPAQLTGYSVAEFRAFVGPEALGSVLARPSG